MEKKIKKKNKKTLLGHNQQSGELVVMNTDTFWNITV